MSVCKTGLNRMPRIVETAYGDIRHRLWSIYWLCRMTHLTGQYVDLGVRGGDSTRAMLAAAEDTGGMVCGINIEDTYKDVLQISCERWIDCDWDRLVFLVDDSVAIGRKWVGEVDFVFVDTTHTYQQTKAEIEAWSPHVRVGGCMAFHDYWLKADGPSDNRDGVKPAVDEWTNASDAWTLETWDAGPDGDTGGAVAWRRK